MDSNLNSKRKEGGRVFEGVIFEKCEKHGVEHRKEHKNTAEQK
jgi:hypothetical protein